MNITRIILSLIFVVTSLSAFSQGEKVELIRANELEGVTMRGESVRKLRGNVVFKQNNVMLYCDSAYQFPQSNRIEAFGNVRLNQADTVTLTGNTLVYNGNTRKAEVRGNVVLRDTKMTLTTDFLDYDLNSKMAAYYNGGKIVDEENRLTSKMGTYNTQTKIFHFKKNVHIENLTENYTVDSDTLHYNTATKIASFKGPTTIVDDSGTLHATEGDYDTARGVSVIKGKSRVRSGDYILEGKRMHFDEKDQVGIIEGDVVVYSTKDSVVITGDRARYWGKSGVSKVFGNAVMRSFPEGDTLFLTADTLVNIDDKLTGVKRLLAFNKCKIFKSDLQGICDSLSYDLNDSILYFFTDPVLWNQRNQIIADSINVEMKNNKIHKMNLNTNAFLVSEDTLGNYNQVKGKKMTGFFSQDQLERVNVDGNSESIYFALEGDTLVVGMNKAECSNMIIKFAESKVVSISFITKPDALFIPPHEIQGPERKLKGFQWRLKEKPAKEDVLRKSSVN